MNYVPTYYMRAQDIWSRWGEEVFVFPESLSITHVPDYAHMEHMRVIH